MTVEELEAAVWQAMLDHRVTTDRPIQFIDAMVRISGRFAGEHDCPEVRLVRRLILEEASRG